MGNAWTSRDIPSQRGKRALVTGATSGIGWNTALELARAGATVVVTGRTQEKADHAAGRIRQGVPDAKLSTASLNLADFTSIRAFSKRQVEEGKPLDLLINNAGVMAIPERTLSADGFEMQFATNILGPFALTGLLLPLLSQSSAPRVVSVSSLAHTKGGPVPVEDLNSAQNYKPMRAYSKTKLEVLLFAQELQRRAGSLLHSVACHPGYARTNLQFHGPSLAMKVASAMLLPVSQNAAAGAQPTLFAAIAPDAKPGAFYGPSHFFGVRGPVKEVRLSDDACNREAAKQLFDELEHLSGVRYGCDLKSTSARS